MSIPVGPAIDRVTYRGRSAAIRVGGAPDLEEAAHRFPAAADLARPVYRGRGNPIKVGFAGGGQLLDDFDRTLEGLMGCTSRGQYKYADPFGVVPADFARSNLWINSISGIYDTPGPNPLHMGGGLKLELPTGCISSYMRAGVYGNAYLELPISRTDNMAVEFDFQSLTPDLMSPDGVYDGYGTGLQATFSLGVQAEMSELGVFIGELTQVYSYPNVFDPTLFRQFVEFDEGGDWIDHDVQLTHPFKHNDFRQGVHVRQQSTRLDSDRVQIDTTVSTLDGTAGLNEYVVSTTTGAVYLAPVASRTFTRVADGWSDTLTVSSVQILLGGSCFNGANVIYPYDGLDFYWLLDNLSLSTDDWNDTVVPTC